MKTNHYNWAVKVAGLLLFAAAAAVLADDEVYSDSTNRVTLSLQFGLNINASFRGIGGGLNPALNSGGGHYDNGYVLTDISGNAGGQSWYWGYDSSSQNNAANHTISFDRTTATAGGNSSASADDSAATPGFELDYDRQLGAKEDWHNVRYGLDSAVNFVPISINNNNTFSAVASKQTDLYSYTPGTTPPTAPYQGSYQGPGFVINVPASSSSTTPIPNSTVSSQDNFDANLFGFHLGPYVELPFGKKQQFTLSLAGGLAVGLLDANESWKQTVTMPGNGTITSTGSGNSIDVLWGWYVGANADYRVSEHWGVAGGVQFQDLGTYDHTFDGRQVSLDLSRSILVLVGVSYNF
jgi:hypothetical protein